MANLSWYLRLPQLKLPDSLTQMPWTIYSTWLCWRTVWDFRGWQGWRALRWQSQPFTRGLAWYGMDFGNLLEGVWAHISVPLRRRRGFLWAQVLKIWESALFELWRSVAISLLAPFRGFWKVSKWKTPTSLITKRPLAALWMSFIHARWPSLTLFRLRSNEPTGRGGVVALSGFGK